MLHFCLIHPESKLDDYGDCWICIRNEQESFLDSLERLSSGRNFQMCYQIVAIERRSGNDWTIYETNNLQNAISTLDALVDNS